MFKNNLVVRKNALFRNVPYHIHELITSLSTCANNNDKSDKSNKKTFNTPHPPKDPPENYEAACVEHEAFDVADFIPATAFRQFASKTEKLGPALQMACLQMRNQPVKDDDIRCLYDYEESNEEGLNCDGDKK